MVISTQEGIPRLESANFWKWAEKLPDLSILDGNV